MRKFTKGVPKHGREYTFNQLLDYARNYCSLAERCTYEISTKLQERGASDLQLSEILKSLIDGKYLSDERYSMAYARSKNRYYGWGPAKISAQLRAKGIAPELIEKSLSALDPEDYEEKMRKLVAKKLESLQKEPASQRKAKTIRFLAGKGYPLGQIIKLVDELILNKT